MRARTALFSLLLLAVAFSCGEHASAAVYPIGPKDLAPAGAGGAARTAG